MLPGTADQKWHLGSDASLIEDIGWCSHDQYLNRLLTIAIEGGKQNKTWQIKTNNNTINKSEVKYECLHKVIQSRDGDTEIDFVFFYFFLSFSFKERRSQPIFPVEKLTNSIKMRCIESSFEICIRHSFFLVEQIKKERR